MGRQRVGKSNRLMGTLLGLGAVAAGFAACGTWKAKVLDDQEALPGKGVGLLFASHGDIDDPATQLEDYIKVSFVKNVGIPLPSWSRGILTEPSYRLSVGTVGKQYEIIGPTNYFANSLEQAKAIDQSFSEILPGAKTYIGFNFTEPFISDALAQMQKDGIHTIVVMNKGAQFSYASSGENLEDVLDYLNEHPEYDAKVFGVLKYSHDPRFIEVTAQALKRDAQNFFPEAKPKDICILLGSHGLPTWLMDTGDSAVEQMKQNVIDIRKALPEFPIYHGFLNDDFFPGATWASPSAGDLAPELVADGCKNVLLDGRLSFTTHHRATLYDLNVEVKADIESGVPGSRAILAPNFDTDPAFASFIAQLTKETLEYQGRSILLKDFSKPALEKGSVGIPGLKIDTVTHLPPVSGWSATPERDHD